MDIRAAPITDGAFVAAAQIGRFTGTISPATAAVLVPVRIPVRRLVPRNRPDVPAGHRMEVPR
jgi:hypothetical protein